MNKTVNMNLGGFFFHIDEDAYQKLNRYFDAIKRSLSNDGREEIMNDIESRISELFSEKLNADKQVLGIKDVDDVIAIMGQPEDYKIEDNDRQETNYNNYASTGKSKKLYRDTEHGILGGVSSGLGHYFHHIEVMADKQEINYQKLLKRLEIEPDEFFMIGNSLKSDVLPVLGIGGYAVHIPFHTTWEHEKISHKVEHANFKTFEKITEVLPILLKSNL